MTLVRGWCPGALRPMPSGDGLILRIRPPLGLIDRAQMEGIAAIALACGNGSVEFTRRANVQLRGLGEATLGQAQARLAALGLIDPDLSPQAEARLNILVTPFWPADGLPGIPGPGPVWAALRAGLVGWNAPPLPPKFGFAVDLSGGQRHLAGESADIRIEAAAEGGILVRADGVATGRRVGSADEAAELALALARWFAAQRPGADRPGRMRALIAQGIAPPAELGGEAEPAPQAALAEALRSCIGFDFGAAEPAQLFRIAAAMDGPLHVTPWRAVRLPRLADPAAALADCPDLLLAPDDPRWRRFACVGAPRCP
ncbi:MAG: precorrin-3B synthase, partial [Rhodobacteraceae bacterium]|nr:precorrin-3B synthase [Paracoccaceae bacterium]